MRAATRFPGFRLRLTRWGGVFLLALLALGAAAVNTGNNALMMVVGIAMGSFVVSGTWSRQVLGNVDVTVRPPRELFAGRAASFEVEVVNRGRLFPAYGVVLRRNDGRALLVEPLLGAGARRRRVVQLVLPRRGWQPLGPWRVEVVLPLGFFLKSKSAVADERVLVYPALLPVGAVRLERRGGQRTAETRARRGREGDVLQLRGFVSGDERRQIHWKQTARQQQLIVVDREAAVLEPLYLVVDPRVREPDDAIIQERFERMISEVATAAVERLQRHEPVGLVLGRLVVPPLADMARCRALLEPLAEAAPQALDDAPPVPAEHAARATFRLEGAA